MGDLGGEGKRGFNRIEGGKSRRKVFFRKGACLVNCTQVWVI